MEKFHHVPRHINLPPLEAVPTGGLKRMVVVMPTFPKCQDAHEPIVHGNVAGVPVLKPPNVAQRVYCPGDMPYPDNTHKEAPEDKWEATSKVQANDWKNYGMQRVRLLDEAVEELLGQIRCVALVNPHPGTFLVKNPTHV